MIYYTGVGSRETPKDICEQMSGIGYSLAMAAWTLRSGAADGADSAFEAGCDKINGRKEIYLPWKNFNHHKSTCWTITDEAYEMAKAVHPAWYRMTQGGQSCHARNCYQILGFDLKTPSSILFCWTPNGKEEGGTRTAIIIAKQNNIPVINLADPNWIVISNRVMEEIRNDRNQ